MITNIEYIEYDCYNKIIKVYEDTDKLKYTKSININSELGKRCQILEILEKMGLNFDIIEIIGNYLEN